MERRIIEKPNTSTRSFRPRIESRNDRYSGSDSVLDDRNKVILDGISSLHSWIKTQTLIPPTQKMTRIRDEIDGVSIQKLFIYLYD